ncbi:MAG: SHOCT domain-containing protein [Phycisphaerales bacterium]
MKNAHPPARTTLALLAAITLAGTLTAGGCGSSTTVEARTTTVGQELQDLEAARSKGLITEDEYSKKREQIMKSK